MLSKSNNALAIPQHESLQSADSKYEKKLENFHYKKNKKTKRLSKVDICNGRQQSWKHGALSARWLQVSEEKGKIPPNPLTKLISSSHCLCLGRKFGRQFAKFRAASGAHELSLSKGGEFGSWWESRKIV